MNRALNISTWSLLLIAVLLLPAFSARERGKMPCERVRFTVTEGNGVMLVSANDLRDYLVAGFDSLEGQPLSEVNPDKIESWLEMNPYVLDAEAHLELNNELVVDIYQEEPMYRIFSPGGSNAYLSRSGRIIPLKPGLPVRVPVVNGFTGSVPEPGTYIDAQNAPRLADLYTLGRFLEKDEFFSRLFNQVYINANGEFTLVPRLGRHNVILGKVDKELGQKMEKLKAFYEQGLIRDSWDRYEKINLKYKNQVVCTKR